VTVADVPAQTVGLFTDTVGTGFTVTVPDIGALEHPDAEIVTVYVPAVVVENDGTFPGLVTPLGTVQV